MHLSVSEHFVPDRLAIAITSMARVGDQIFLGLTGGPRLLASYDTISETFEMGPEICPWIGTRGYCGKIHNSLGVLADGRLLLGECSHLTWDGLPVTTNYFSTELPERMLALKHAQGHADVTYTDFCLENLEQWDRATCDPGGRILSYDPASGNVQTSCKLPAYLYSQSMIVDAARNRAYGHTIPDNHFFEVNLDTGRLRDHGRISEYAFHNLVVTPNGVCYGAWLDRADGAMKLLKFDPAEGRLRHLDKIILKDPGLPIAGNRGIDQWLVVRDGSIYMGTIANSLLFRFDPDLEEFELLARLAEGGRVTTLEEDSSGMLWASAGYPHTHLVRFDPSISGAAAVTDFGPVNPLRERCYFHASCLHNDKLYLGETDGFTPSLHVVELPS